MTAPPTAAQGIGFATRELERVPWKDMARSQFDIPLRGRINLNEFPAERRT